ncbi:MAG: hypothetical protein CMH79_05300 [Nitrospinae bacterium]|nr:hypothetical protein [Nitrospinota bacterium]
MTEMGQTQEKLKLTKKSFYELKKMLEGSAEDFEIALENISNMDMSSISILLLGKSLMYGKRNEFMLKFEPSIKLVFQSSQEKDLLSPYNMAWDNLFKVLKNNPYLTDLDKDLVESELSTLVGETLVSLDYDFIKNLKFDLKW